MEAKDKKFLREDFPALLKRITNPSAPRNCESESKNFVSCMERCQRESGTMPQNAAKNQAKKLERCFADLKQLENALFDSVDDAIGLTKKALKEFENHDIPYDVGIQKSNLFSLENLMKSKKKELADFYQSFTQFKILFDLASKGQFATMNANFAKSKTSVQRFIQKLQRWRSQLQGLSIEIGRYCPVIAVPFVEEYLISYRENRFMVLSDKSKQVLIAIMMTADKKADFKGTKKIIITSARRNAEEQGKIMYSKLQERRAKSIGNYYYYRELKKVADFFFYATGYQRSSGTDMNEIYNDFMRVYPTEKRPEIDEFTTYEQPKDIKDKIIEIMIRMINDLDYVPHIFDDKDNHQTVDLSKSEFQGDMNLFQQALAENMHLLISYSPVREINANFHIEIRQ